MNNDFVNNIELYYSYAERIAPGYGHDIVHHICTEIPNKVDNIDAYVHTSIRNAYRNKHSSFNRLFNPQLIKELPDIESDGVTYDSILLHTIFLEMEIEGFSLEVSVFKDCYFGSSIAKFSKKTGINERTIVKICKFVRNEIIRRYTVLDNQ